MGQAYSVYFHMKFCDGTGEKFCKSVREDINRLQDSGEASFNLEGLNLLKPLDCFLAVAGKDRYAFTGDNADNGYWYSDSEGSYGWESVMCKIFEKAARYLGNGGRIDISVDLTPWHSFIKERNAVSVWHRGEE